METTTRPVLSIDDVAAIIGVVPGTVRSYRHAGRLPDPDHTDPVSGRPGWYRETIDQWNANRPGPGYRTDLAGK